MTSARFSVPASSWRHQQASDPDSGRAGGWDDRGREVDVAARTVTVRNPVTGNDCEGSIRDGMASILGEGGAPPGDFCGV